LNTGGPRMSVQEVSEIVGVSCSWFDDKNNLKNGGFASESLVKPEDLPRMTINIVGVDPKKK
jgi:uncharacterized protein YodC (DUF2158 family)